MQYNQIEKEIQHRWEEKKAFCCDLDSDQESFYCLTMFPYPSGRLHMGHVRNYTIGDVVARAKRMQGFNVFFPIGWDAFGLPAENAALAHQCHPEKWTRENIEHMRGQLKSLGLSYDWDKELATCDKEYYKHEQWIFLKLYEKGLIYKKKSEVNWDPVDKTVLANEQVIDGKGWRSGALVERKMINQWFYKITDYAAELEGELERLPGWPNQVIVMQKNWIGLSRGLQITFDVKGLEESLSVFTTRPDTLLGVSYLAISPWHPLAEKALLAQPLLQEPIEALKVGTSKEQDLATMEKRGVDSTLKAIHPLTGELLPIWIANYVLMDYGTGAVMAVPAHDLRDYEFAQRYLLPIKAVIGASAQGGEELPYCEPGVGIVTPYQGLSSEQISEKIASTLESESKAHWKTQVRLRDWGVSRQRYWGAPIPMILCASCGDVPVPEASLPVELPLNLQVHQGETLKTHESFTQTSCPQCGQKATRETDTFDTFMESSWYYARFLDHDNPKNIVRSSRAKKWLPVNQYIGGIEHAILHLLYARFLHKALRDLGEVFCDEPFESLFTQGMVLKDGSKMSKSKGNVVCPQSYIEKYGADTIRLFMMFQAPSEQSLEWSDSAVEGAYRYLNRLSQFVLSLQPSSLSAVKSSGITFGEKEKDLRRTIYQTLEKVQKDYEKRLSFNTAISSAMILTNELISYQSSEEKVEAVLFEGAWVLVHLLSPIIPHLCQHLFEHLSSSQDLIMEQRWPKLDKDALVSETLELVVQVNGKKRAEIVVSAKASKEDIIAQAKEHENVVRFLQGSTVRKAIVVPGRLVNLVL